MGFKEKLKEHLKSDLSEDKLAILPRGFQTLGKTIILKLNPKLYKHEELIGGACLELFPNIKSIYVNRGRIVGSFREPEKIEFVVGEDKSVVEHKEHNVIYRFDITKIMFSKGNINERKHLPTLVKNGEIIVDMFAGIGYFSLPIAKHTNIERIYSIELNSKSFKYLKENIKLNHLEQKIVPIKGDCNIEVKKLSESGIRADRIIMGVFPAPKNYIKNALSLVKNEGTTFHYEGVAEKDNIINLFKEFSEITDKEGFKSELKAHRIVKSYGPNLYHVVLDIFVLKI